MSRGEIRVGDIGTVFILTVKDQDDAVVDISGASTKQIIFREPDDTAVVKTAAFTTDGTDGKMQYTTVADDLDQVGEWQHQGKVVIGSGTWKTDIEKFKVYSNLPES